MNLTKFFNKESRKLTIINSYKLNLLRVKINSILSHLNESISLICVPQYKDQSAEALCSCGIISFTESFLKEAPDNVLLTVGLHECIHLQVGGEFRRSFIKKYSDIDAFFHNNIVSDWLYRKIDIRSDEDFVSTKTWRHLYEGWSGPLSIDFQEATKTINKYFDLLKAGMIVNMNGKLFCRSQKESSFTHKSIEELYKQDSGILTYYMMTGFELIDYFLECYKAKLRNDLYGDLWVLEEGFVNYISTSLVGITLEDINDWAPQDKFKIELANKIKAKAPSIKEALSSVVSYYSLVDFYRKIEII